MSDKNREAFDLWFASENGPDLSFLPGAQADRVYDLMLKEWHVAIAQQLAQVVPAPAAQDEAERMTWEEAVRRASVMLDREQERLTAEDYLMDSKDCIDVLRESIATSPAAERPDAVKVRRELLERIAKRGIPGEGMNFCPQCGSSHEAITELRSLLDQLPSSPTY